MLSAHDTTVVRPDVELDKVNHIFIKEHFNEFIDVFKKEYIKEDNSIKSYLIFINRLKRDHKDFIDKLNSVIGEEYYREVIYCILKDIDELPLCPVCNNYNYLRNWKKGFQHTCCKKCLGRFQSTDIERNEKIRIKNKLNNPITIKQLDNLGLRYEYDDVDKNYMLIYDYCKHHKVLRIYKTQMDRIFDHGRATLCKQCNQEIYDKFNPTEEEMKTFIEEWPNFYKLHSQGLNKDTWILFYPREKKMLDLYYKNISDRDADDCEKYYCISNKLTEIPTCNHPHCTNKVKYGITAMAYFSYCDDHKYSFHSDSNFERSVRDYVESLDCSTLCNSRVLLGEQNRKREIDILLPVDNAGIECNGSYYHSSKKKEMDYHKKKFEQCKENNIHLLSIWDDLWLLKRDVCKSAINTLLGLNKIVEGYLCDVHPVYHLLMSSFVSENYMYNYKQSQYGLALFYENEPVAMITYNLSYIKIDIIHYVIKKGFDVKNAFKCLLDELHRIHSEIRTIEIEVDADFSDGTEQELAGMKYVSTSLDNWMWFRSGHRYPQDTFTEKQIEKYDLAKCYGSGLLKYRIEYPKC